MRALCGFMSKTKNLAICHSANLPFGFSNGYIDGDGRLQRYSIYSILYFIYIIIYIKLVNIKDKYIWKYENANGRLADWQIRPFWRIRNISTSKVTDICLKCYGYLPARRFVPISHLSNTTMILIIEQFCLFYILTFECLLLHNSKKCCTFALAIPEKHNAGGGCPM